MDYLVRRHAEDSFGTSYSRHRGIKESKRKTFLFFSPYTLLTGMTCTPGKSISQEETQMGEVGGVLEGVSGFVLSGKGNEPFSN